MVHVPDDVRVHRRRQRRANNYAGTTTLATTAVAAATTAMTTTLPPHTHVAVGSPCLVAGRRTCTSLSLQIDGRTGAYQGKAIGMIKNKLAPDGVLWTWQQCADMCLNYDGYRASNGLPGKDDAVCAYFLVSKQKGYVRGTLVLNGATLGLASTGTGLQTMQHV